MLFFLVIFDSFFIIPVEIENARLKLALTILASAPMTVANDAIEKLLIVTDKTTYQNSQEKQYIY